MTGDHSSKQYDADLETIRSKVLLMGGIVERQFQDAMASFRVGNSELAERVARLNSSLRTRSNWRRFASPVKPSCKANFSNV